MAKKKISPKKSGARSLVASVKKNKTNKSVKKNSATGSVKKKKGSTNGIDLSAVLTVYAEYWKYELEEMSPGFFRLFHALGMKDGSTRHQNVFIRTENPGHEDERIYVTSRCGIFHDELDFYGILRTAMNCNYSAVTVFQERTKGGNMRDTLVIQAAPSARHTTPVLLGSIIFEVARMADTIEMNFFGGEEDYH